MRIPWWFPFGEIEEIAPRALRAKLENDGADLQLLDVRTVAEFESGHIDRARNVPIHSLPQRLAELGLDPSRAVIAICLSGHRSLPTYRLLKRAGFRTVYGLTGGMLAWYSSRLPMMRDGAA
jgi:rhodanese-related sulfurtransferase